MDRGDRIERVCVIHKFKAICSLMVKASFNHGSLKSTAGVLSPRLQCANSSSLMRFNVCGTIEPFCLNGGRGGHWEGRVEKGAAGGVHVDEMR